MNSPDPTLARTALLAASAFGLALVVELAILSVWPRTVHGIGWLPVFMLLVGWLVGAVVGVATGLLRRTLGASEDRFLLAWAASPVSICVLWILAAQLNHHLPFALSSSSGLAINGGLLLVVIAVTWRWRRHWRSCGQRLSGRRGVTAMLLLSTSIAAALIVSRGDEPRVEAVERWTPSPTPTITTQSDASPPRLLVVGFDGATWSIIDPLLESGRMPNVERLLEGGRRGVLLNPDIAGRPSPVAWTTIFTGVAPERHGVTGWESLSLDRRARALWELTDAAGLETLVVNVPGSYPAETLASGGIIAGDPAPTTMPGTSRGWWCSGEPELRAAPTKCGIGRRRHAGEIVVTFPISLGVAQAFRASALGITLYRMTSFRLVPELHSAIERSLDLLAPRVLSLTLSSSAPAKADAAATRRRHQLGIDGWSPWLRLSRGEERFLFRVWADVSRDTPRSYGTPFFREEVEGLAVPSWLLADLDDAEPYVVGGDGSSLGWDASGLLTLNEDILEALTRLRARRTLRLMEVTSPQIVLHVFRHPDRAHHTYWRFFEPESFPSPLRPSPDRVQRFSDAIPAAYENVDRLLGELLERTGPKTLVAVVSDHGAQGGIHAPYGHHEEGIYILSGPRIVASSATGPVLRQEDLLPVLMAHLGLPVAQDLEGTVPSGLLPRDQNGEAESLATVDTYGARAVSWEEHRRLDEDLQERLRSLGYLDG